MDSGYLPVLLKHAIGGALMPLPLTLIGLALSTLLLWFRRTKSGRLLLTLTVLFFFVVTNDWVSQRLITPLETTYPAIPDYSRPEDLPPELRACKAIAVLGSGNGYAPERAATDELCTSGIARLTAAVRLARLLPDARIIFSGTTPGDIRPHAQVMRDAAISLGVSPTRISLIEGVRDTEDEAHRLAAQLSGEPFVLVTSAWHLPRAVGLCRKLGLNPVPAPSDFLESPGNSTHPSNWSWSYGSLERSTCAFHEALGLLWTRLRGQR